MGRRSAYLLAVPFVALAAWWLWPAGGRDGARPSTTDERDEREAHADTADDDDEGAAGSTRPAARTARGPRAAPGGEDAGRPRATYDRPFHEMMARSFETTCAYGPARLCVAGRPLAAACAAGDGRACAGLAEQMIMTPPRMPDLAVIALRAACDLKDTAACDRWDQLLEWRESAKAALAVTPTGPSTAATDCRAGEPLACWYLVQQQRRAKVAIDVQAGWRACDAGIVDACGELAHAAPDGASMLLAYERGCAQGGLLLCRALVEIYQGNDGDCILPPLPPPPQREGLPCVEPDPASAARIIAWIEQLTGEPYVPPAPDEDE